MEETIDPQKEQVFDESAGVRPASSFVTKKSSGDSWFGLVLIFIGGIFFLNTFNIVPWEIWTQLWKFWPLLLVFAGLKLLLGNSFLSNVVTLLFAAIVLFFIAIYFFSDSVPQIKEWTNKNFDWLPEVNFGEFMLDTATFSTELSLSEFPDVKAISFDIRHGARDFTLSDNTTIESFFSLDAEYDTSYGTPTVVGVQEDENLTVEVNLSTGSGLTLGIPGKAEYVMQIGDTKELFKELSINVGSGSGDIKLANNPLERVNISMGSGNVDASFKNEAVPNNLDLEMGSGSMEILLPTDVNLEIVYEIGSGKFEIDDSSVTGNGTFRSSNNGADKTVNINVKIGSGSLSITRN